MSIQKPNSAEENGTITLSESVSFRINKKVMEQLRANSVAVKTTLNAFVNQTLTSAVEWYIPSSKTGWVSFPKDTLVSLIEAIPEEKLVKIASETGKAIPKDTLLGMVGRVSVKDWALILKYRAEAAGFVYTELNEGKERRIIQQHNMGPKWSEYWKHYYKESFAQLGCDIKCTATENTIVYTIDNKFLD